MTLHKVLKYLAIVIGVIGLVLLARVVITGDEAIEIQQTFRVVCWFLSCIYLTSLY